MRSVLALILAWAPSAGDAAAAEELYEQANDLHAQGRLAEASDALAQAYIRYPDRDFLFARGVVEREAGHCDVAVPLFEAFLDKHPPVVAVQATEKELRACRDAEPAPEPEVKPSPPRPASSPPPVEAAPAPEPRRSPRIDRGSVALLATGGGVAVVGGALLVGAAVRAQDADAAPTAGAYRDVLRGARGLNAAGATLLAVGSALLLAGLIRHAVLRARRR